MAAGGRNRLMIHHFFFKKNETNQKKWNVSERAQILNSKSSFSLVEDYKAIRANIIFSIPADGCKLIGITSADSMEGKSINCLNQAITFAETGARVLVMDCDLRLPKLGRLLAQTSVPGVSNVLVGLSNLTEAIQKTEYKGLDVLLSGTIPPNPSELLGSAKMKALLEQLKSQYDYILVDTPPINVVSDALVLSEFLTGVVIIVRSGVTEKESVRSAVEQLRFVNATILGFVLNAVPDERSKRYKKYYSKYDRYYRYGKAQKPTEENPNQERVKESQRS